MTPAEILKRAIAGLTDESQPEMQWYEKLIELDRQHKEFEREREAREQAEQAAAVAPQTTAGIVRAAIANSSGSSGHIPLNGAAVLRAALAGGPGTINGSAAE
jgi:hypothetical protein